MGKYGVGTYFENMFGLSDIEGIVKTEGLLKKKLLSENQSDTLVVVE